MALAHREPHHIALTPRIIAEYCQVSKSTVIKWIKDEKLKSFRLPSGHYRIDWDDFKEFLEKYHMPLKEWFYESEIPSKIEKEVKTNGSSNSNGIFRSC